MTVCYATMSQDDICCHSVWWDQCLEISEQGQQRGNNLHAEKVTCELFSASSARLMLS